MLLYTITIQVISEEGVCKKIWVTSKKLDSTPLTKRRKMAAPPSCRGSASTAALNEALAEGRDDSVEGDDNSGQ